jgi:hypothetical protein
MLKQTIKILNLTNGPFELVLTNPKDNEAARLLQLQSYVADLGVNIYV